jgi:hypothetical protein
VYRHIFYWTLQMMIQVTHQHTGVINRPPITNNILCYLIFGATCFGLYVH